jgi:4-hydroxybenzoate polyprenyltransferase
MILIRHRAWWFNKIPLSVFLGIALVAGKPLTPHVGAAFVALVAAVCCAANYGYALNDLFDLEEDRRGGRVNAAANVSRRYIWMIIALSGAGALAFATAAAGIAGLALTSVELMLPLVYSIPPIRVKERGLPGILADALAAHVYPALLALIVVQHLGLYFTRGTLTVTVGLWALATGLRGIISHQLQAAEHDQMAGLSTIVHWLGHREMASFVVFFILPTEVVCFTAMIVEVHSAFLLLMWIIYVAYECLKSALDVFPVTVFTRRGQRYLPFVDEGFYKVWGPMAAILAAGLTDPLYLFLLPTYVVLFKPRVASEWAQICTTGEAAHKLVVRSAVRK